ncbi:MAG: hypothetical protein ACKOE2_15975 [Actinomycetales bacterium]
MTESDQVQALLQSAEDLADLQAVALARADMLATGERPIPWERVKADLGLT